MFGKFFYRILLTSKIDKADIKISGHFEKNYDKRRVSNKESFIYFALLSTLSSHCDVTDCIVYTIVTFSIFYHVSNTRSRYGSTYYIQCLNSIDEKAKKYTFSDA